MAIINRNLYSILYKGGDFSVVQLRVLEILKEQEKTKYWLYKRMEMSYQNFNKMVTNQTKSIHYDKIQKLCELLECSVGDLFEITEEEK